MATLKMKCPKWTIKIKMVATGLQTCDVVVESSSRSVLNLLNFGANKGNVSDLSDYIRNEVNKLCQFGDIPMVNQDDEHSMIWISKPEIRMK